MRPLTPLAIVAALAIAPSVVFAQLPDARQVAQERARAEVEVPQLAALLGLTPGMTVADVGAGFGASTVVFAKWIGNGRVFATDIGQRQLQAIRDYVARESLSNVTTSDCGATSWARKSPAS